MPAPIRIAKVMALAGTLPIALADVGARDRAQPGLYNSSQATRGEAIYHARCASCHGGALGGMDTNPPLAGGRFLANWSGKSIGTLARRIRGTMPLEDPGSLTHDQTADVVAFMLQANAFPIGTTELSSIPDELDGLVITAPPTEIPAGRGAQLDMSDYNG